MKKVLAGMTIVTVVVAAGCGYGGDTEEMEPMVDEATQAAETDGTVLRNDAAMDDLVPLDAVVEKVADGFTFTEGPVWVPGDTDRLYFSDIPENKVYRWSEGEGAVVFLEPVLAEDADTGGTGGSNGLALHPDGRLVLCEHGNRVVSAMALEGERVNLADRYDGKRLNSPNDIVFHSSGAAFFTDPPYGLDGHDASENKEQEHNGIYRLDPDGTVTLLETGQTRPNGLGLSPDETVLYVANSDAAPNRYWKKYAVNDDLTLGEGEMFFDASDMVDLQGAPDGLAVDVDGNVFATGPGGVMVFAPDGRHLGTIAPAELPANTAFGGDGSTLYMTARSGLYRIATNTRGDVYAGGE